MTSVAVVIPTLGSATLESCLQAVSRLDPPPTSVVVVRSGAPAQITEKAEITTINFPDRLGFARAVNAGLAAVPGRAEMVAVLNDDAIPQPGWLDQLTRALDAEPSAAAVQTTVTDGNGATVDGRGIEWDAFGLPVQIDRGRDVADVPRIRQPVLAVSATAAVYRVEALRQVAMPHDTVFDPSFDSYHEDLDLGLRLARCGWLALWVPGSSCRHLGSVSGSRFRWRHPWWVLANRWRALAGNLSPGALVRNLPCLLRGEARALRTLARSNPRALLVGVAVCAAWPALVIGGWRRLTPGRRLTRFPGSER